MCSLGTKNLKNLHQCVPREHTHFPNLCHNPSMTALCRQRAVRGTTRSATGARVCDPQQRHLQPPRQSLGNRHSVTKPKPRSGASGERRHISFLNRSCSPIRVTYPRRVNRISSIVNAARPAFGPRLRFTLTIHLTGFIRWRLKIILEKSTIIRIIRIIHIFLSTQKWREWTQMVQPHIPVGKSIVFHGGISKSL